MQTQSLRASALISCTFAALAPLAGCQAPPQASASEGTALPSKNTDANDALPPFLLEVPSGDVVMGLDLEAFLKATAEAAFPYDPKNAHTRAKDKLKRAMRQTASVLGRETRHVDSFLLGKWPVKNSEYMLFVEKQRAAGVEMRAPFLLWKEGCPKDYEDHLKEVRKEFPKDGNGAVLYWERHGHELPFKMQDKDGNSVDDLPVVYVSWRDANRFAASVGMRLPTEAELTRAMRGDGTHTWPGGDRGEEHDKYSDQLLKDLRMATTRDLKLKPIGTAPLAKGPYGHLDLFGQVWQLCGDLGYEPLHGLPPFLKQWEKLQKNKVGRILENKPGWDYDRAIAKGGSYLSYQEPVQLLIDARAPVLTVDVLESLGFRLAKSLRPGYDYLYSMQRIGFSRDIFEKDQDLDLASMVGGERYTLADNGFPSEYEAVAFAPVNWLLDAKSVRLKTLLDGSQESPLMIGALAITCKLQDGTEPGLYALSYRAAGVPKALSAAIKQGHKEIVKARKAAEKAKKSGKDKKPKKEKKKKQGKASWRTLVRRYGLTDDDLANKKAATGNLGYIRIDGRKIEIAKDQYLLSKNDKVVGTLLGTNKKPATGKPAPSTMKIEGDKQGKAVVKFDVSIPLLKRSPKKTIVFTVQALLDTDAPTTEKKWRLPTEPGKDD